MNGAEKLFFETEFIKLKTRFSERWKAHEERSEDFKKLIQSTFDSINKNVNSLCNTIKGISNRVMQLPCDLHKQRYDTIEKDFKNIIENDIKHINNKLNALLFTVLGSVFVLVIIFGIQALLKFSGGG